jgi:hypothetical protein
MSNNDAIFCRGCSRYVAARGFSVPVWSGPRRTTVFPTAFRPSGDAPPPGPRTTSGAGRRPRPFLSTIVRRPCASACLINGHQRIASATVTRGLSETSWPAPRPSCVRDAKVPDSNPDSPITESAGQSVHRSPLDAVVIDAPGVSDWSQWGPPEGPQPPGCRPTADPSGGSLVRIQPTDRQ